MRRPGAVFVLGLLAGCDLVFPPGSGPSGVADGPPGGDDAPPPPDGGDSPDGADSHDAVILDDAPLSAADASFACPASYISIPGSTSQYHFYGTLGWLEAVGRCTSDQAMVPSQSHAQIHLVVLDDEWEQVALYSMWFDYNLWVGLSDRRTEGVFQTVSTQAPAFPPASGGPWATNQPDDGGAGQDCAYILSFGAQEPGKLDDDDCGAVQYDFVCECDVYADDPSKY